MFQIPEILKSYNLEEIDQLSWNECGYSVMSGGIERLGFYGLDLGEMPSKIYELVDLKMLSVIHNNLSELSTHVGQLKDLEELYIGGNQMTHLPKTIGQLKKLKYLYVFEDQLKDIPESLGQLEGLEELVIGTKTDVDLVQLIKSYGIKAKKIVINDVPL